MVKSWVLISLQLLLIGTGVVSAQPSTPSNLEGVSLFRIPQVNLRWDAPAEAVTGYRVYRDTIQIADITETTYQDKTAVVETTYSYTVSAYDGVGESAQTSPIMVTTADANPTLPPAVDYFPFGIYLYPVTFTGVGWLNPTAADVFGPHAQHMRDAGIDLLLAATAHNVSHVDKVLEIFAPLGIRSIPFGTNRFLFERDITTSAFQDEYDAKKTGTNGVPTQVASYLNHPFIAGWYPVEEYDTQGIEGVRQFTSLFQEHDQTHPVFTENNNFDAFDVEDPPVFDGMIVGTYPFRYLFGSIASFTHPNENMEFYVTHRLIPFIAELETKAVKPTLWGLFQASPLKAIFDPTDQQVVDVMAVLTEQEMFDQGWVYDAGADKWEIYNRYFPTEGGTRGMMWLATALGVKGLVTFEYGGYYNTSTQTHRAHWTELTNTIAEIKPFTPLLSNLEMQGADLATSPDTRVFIRTHRDVTNNLDFVIVVNQKIAADVVDPQSLFSVDADGFLLGYTIAPARSDLTVDPVGTDLFFDLHTLALAPGSTGGNFDITLEGGQGKIYLVGDEADFSRYQTLYPDFLNSDCLN